MMDHQIMHHGHHGHNLQNHQSSVNWNYSPTAISVPITSTPISNNNASANNNSSTNNTWTPPRRTRGVKRAMSESDCDDIYSEESSKEHASSMENDSCQLQSRKKRRGVIEKKRRDRINLSLTELKRLVPTAFEKQGSAKLEKAEILQLTVDHLKTLHSKGVDSIGFDPQRFAMDYHIIGFRECATEVARYLVTVEGMDIQDPLRLRLMSHLQCFAAQRELSAKSSTTNLSATPNWPTFQSGYQPNYSASTYQSYPSTPVTPHNQQHQQQQNFNSSYLSSSSSYLSTPSNTSILSSTATSQSPEYSANYGSANTTSSSSSIPASANTSSSKFEALSPEVTTGASATIVSVEDQQPIYTDLSNTNDRLHNYHYNNAQIYGPNNNNNGYNNNVKPYRPWHPSEMAY